MLRDAGGAYAVSGVEDLVRLDVEKLSLPPGGWRARPLAKLAGGEVWTVGYDGRLARSMLNDANAVAQLFEDADRLGMHSYLPVGGGNEGYLALVARLCDGLVRLRGSPGDELAPCGRQEVDVPEAHPGLPPRQCSLQGLATLSLR